MLGNCIDKNELTLYWLLFFVCGLNDDFGGSWQTMIVLFLLELFQMMVEHAAINLRPVNYEKIIADFRDSFKKHIFCYIGMLILLGAFGYGMSIK